MTRFKCMSLCVLMVIAIGGIKAFSQVPAPVCSLKVGPISGLCDGADDPGCGNCHTWWPPASYVTWSAGVTRGTAPGLATEAVISYVIPCKITTPCTPVFFKIRKCDFYGTTCIGGWGTCTDYIPGTPVAATYTTYLAMDCPPPPPPPAPHGA